MSHQAVWLHGLRVCLACHLLWPCLDGRILQAKAGPRDSVNMIRQRLVRRLH